jgi:hypothetical protein
MNVWAHLQEARSYLEVRRIHHRRPDRLVNHVRLCFLAYWLSARLGGEWRARGETEAVPHMLRHLQTIRVEFPARWEPPRNRTGP